MTNREIDILVAEHVFCLGPYTHEADWTNGSNPSDSNGDFPGWWCRACKGDTMPPMIHVQKPEQVTHCNYVLRQYSADMRTVWPVVDAMRDGRFSFALSVSEESEAYFYRAGGPIPRSGVTDAETPRAICLAALKALGVEVAA